MNEERYLRLEELFHGALAQPEDEREAWIAARCAGEPGLRAELEGLLAADRDAGERLAETAVRAPPGPDPSVRETHEPPFELPGHRFVRCLGAGGMGVVWEVEQEQPPRRVAVKVLRPGLSSAAVLRRFANEVRALARLEHPGIARLYDAGVVEVGGQPLPYLVLELVRGEPLLAWAARRGLDRRARCELLRSVAEAVQAAHDRGVLHRDLKASNVLVDATGRPRVLDFGVARLLADAASASGGGETTHAGELVGTLEVMSPEQAAGPPDALDGRTDVYSLGCLLHELLGGSPPFDFRGVGLLEAVRRIHEEEPARLGSLDRSLAGDLETIVHACLAKSRDERYASAGALAEDLARHLADLPIRARPAPPLRRLAKLVRRNRAPVLGLAIALAALVAAALLVRGSARREEGARERSERSAEGLRRRELAEGLAAVRAALDGDDPAAAAGLLARLPASERGWERDWLARRAAAATPRDVATGAQVYALARAGGERIATGHRDRTVRLYRADTCEELGRVETGAHVRALAATEDGAYLAALSVGPSEAPVEVALLATEPGLAPVRRERLAGSDLPAAPAIDPRGTWAAFAGPGGRLLVWALPGGETVLERAFEGAELLALAAAPDGGRLWVSVGGPAARLEALDPASGRTAARVPTAPLAVRGLVLPGGGAVVGRSGRALRAWRADGAAPVLSLDGADEVLVLAPVSPGRVLAADAAGRVLDLDLARGELVRSARGRFGRVSALCALDGGDEVAVGYEAGRVELLDLASGRSLLTQPPILTDPVYGLLALPERERVVVALSSHLRWTPFPVPAFQELVHGSYVYDAVFLGARGLLATAGWDARVRLWDARDRRPRGEVALDDAALGLAAAPDEGSLYVAERERLLRLDLAARADGTPVAQVRWRSEPREARPQGVAVVVSPDGARVLRASLGLLVAHAADDGRELRATDLGAPVVGARWDPAGNAVRVLTEARLLELRPETLATLRAWSLPGRGAALAPDGRGGWLVGLEDGRLLRQAAGEDALAPVASLGSAVLALAVSPDGARLAAGTRGGEVEILDAGSWSALLGLDPHVPGPREPTFFYVHDLDWSPDGRSLVSSSGDGTARVWDAGPERD